MDPIVPTSKPTQLIIPRVVWGCVMTSMGYVENWSGLMAARWFLGMAEAGLFPGINYFLSCWYKRDEFGIRAVSSNLLPYYNRISSGDTFNVFGSHLHLTKNLTSLPRPSSSPPPPFLAPSAASSLPQSRT
jgi:hypothetical protein